MDLSVRVPLAPRPLTSRRASLLSALALSAFVHLAIAWRLTFGAPAIAMRGEDGREGGGGATFEVSVQGPEADVPAPPITPAPSAAPLPSAVADPRRAALRPVTRVLPPERDGTEASAAVASATTPPSETGSEGRTAVAAAGTGDAPTDSGRMQGRDDARIRALLAGSVGGALGGSALGDVAILEAASRCPDPVAGTWTAHRYSPEFRDWARFTLSIRRVGDDLTGTIRTRMWRGLPSDTCPPPCSPGGWDYTVEMRAHGTVHGDQFDFGAQEHHVAHVECASPLFGYNPDHFSGSWDVERDQLRTLNNDGGRDVDAAYTFRRSSCQP